MTEKDISEKNIERLIDLAGPELHVPAAKRTEIVETLSCSHAAAGRRKSAWRTSVRRIGQLSTAALIGIAVMLLINQFGGSIDGATAAFGQVTRAVEKVPWIAISGRSEVTQNELELLISPRHQIRVVKTQDGRMFWSDFLRRQRKVYDPKDNTLTISYEYESDEFDVEDESPYNYLSLITAPELLEGATVSRRSEVVEGQETEVYEITKSEGEGTVFIAMRTDAGDKLPMTITVKALDRAGQIVEFIEGRCDYPETGPKDIYELGVPKEARVIDELPSPEAEELLQICKSYRANFSAYISIVVLKPDFQIEVNYVNGDVSKAGRYFKKISYTYLKWSDRNRVDQEAEKGFDSFLDWIENSGETTLFSIDLWDGKYRHLVRQGETPSYRKVRSTGSFRDIYGYAWPYYQPSGRIIEDEYSRENNFICLKAYDCLFYFDPEHDYVCVKREYMNNRSDAVGTRRYIREVRELAQTEDGWWYPHKVEWIRVNLGTDGEEVSRQVNVADEIYLKIVSEFPAGIFDSKNLPKELK